MYNRHPWPLKKSKSWGPFWSYQPNSMANLANVARFVGKWAGLAVLSSWYLQNGPQDFDFLTTMDARAMMGAHYYSLYLV